jgi:alpha-galactosidase
MRGSVAHAVVGLAAALAVGFGAVGAGTQPALTLSDGPARVPPMGFNDWNAVGCSVSARLIEQTADALVATGMKAAGYRFVNVDDCWLTAVRTSGGLLQADPVKFPLGIRALADYVHRRGLRFGIYEDAGTQTCTHFAGSYGHEAQDARTFASWGVDYLKYDWCNIPFGDFPGQTHQQVARLLYGRMRDALLATGRPIVFSMCNGWDPTIQPQTWARSVSNLWRTTDDISDSYSSMVSIFHQNVALAALAGPGGWNDPDMLEVGNAGMTDPEYRSHFSLWSEMAAPLLAGTDLRRMTGATRTIYTNREVIAVDQDRLGEQGSPVASAHGHWVLTKPLANGERAVVLFNETDAPTVISTTPRQLGLPRARAYELRDLWRHTSTETTRTISAAVGPRSTVMYRVGVADEKVQVEPPRRVEWNV